MKKLLVLAAVVVCTIAAVGQSGSTTEVQQLSSYLKSHWQSPEDYVISKFQDHDIVFLGEYHKIRHDAELVQTLIPRLYKAGVYNLGFEFANSEDQADLDRLLTSASYDEDLARRILFRGNSSWGYREYLDIYKSAWKLNRSLSAGAPRFRVVNLMYKADWSALQGERTPEVMQKVWRKGDPDEYMASVALEQFVAKNQKALIYCGIHHAFTRYKQPVYDFEKAKLYRLNGRRLGNLVYERIGGRAMTIFLHSPWVSAKGFDKPNVKPANGVIDAVGSVLKDMRVGFDLVGSPFESLTASDTYYAFGYKDFKLADFADGYIYQKPFREYQGVTVDPLFVTKANFDEAVADVDNPEYRKQVKSPEQFLSDMAADADIPRRFAHLF